MPPLHSGYVIASGFFASRAALVAVFYFCNGCLASFHRVNGSERATSYLFAERLSNRADSPSPREVPRQYNAHIMASRRWAFAISTSRPSPRRAEARPTGAPCIAFCYRWSESVTQSVGPYYGMRLRPHLCQVRSRRFQFHASVSQVPVAFDRQKRCCSARSPSCA